MTIVDEAIALLKQWQSAKKTVTYLASSGSITVFGAGECSVSYRDGELNLGGLVAKTSVDASSVQSVQDNTISILVGETLVNLRTLP